MYPISTISHKYHKYFSVFAVISSCKLHFFAISFINFPSKSHIFMLFASTNVLGVSYKFSGCTGFHRNKGYWVSLEVSIPRRIQLSQIRRVRFSSLQYKPFQFHNMIKIFDSTMSNIFDWNQFECLYTRHFSSLGYLSICKATRWIYNLNVPPSAPFINHQYYNNNNIARPNKFQ